MRAKNYRNYRNNTSQTASYSLYDDFDDEDEDDENYLGASTLAKLRDLSGLFDDEDELDESPSEVDIVREETTTETSLQEVNFSCYFPQEVEPNRRFGFYVYAHLEDAVQEISKDVTRFSDELGDFVPKPKKSKKKAHLQLETPITVIPECDEIEFDPPKLTKKWDIPWSRFGFDFSHIPQINSLF